MFDILFTSQKWNKTTLLIWTAPHGPFIRSAQTSNGFRSVSSLEQMYLLIDKTRSRNH